MNVFRPQALYLENQYFCITSIFILKECPILIKRRDSDDFKQQSLLIEISDTGSDEEEKVCAVLISLTQDVHVVTLN